MYFKDGNSEGFEREVTETLYMVEVTSFEEELEKEYFNEEYLEDKIEDYTNKYNNHAVDLEFTHVASGNTVLKINNH
jgi:hypothetical protein